jgi:hypothetical protein
MSKFLRLTFYCQNCLIWCVTRSVFRILSYNTRLIYRMIIQSCDKIKCHIGETVKMLWHQPFSYTPKIKGPSSPTLLNQVCHIIVEQGNLVTPCLYNHTPQRIIILANSALSGVIFTHPFWVQCHISETVKSHETIPLTTLHRGSSFLLHPAVVFNPFESSVTSPPLITLQFYSDLYC